MTRWYRQFQTYCFAALAMACLSAASTLLAESKVIPLSAAKVDPNARQVELFDGIDEKVLEAKMIPKDEFGGNVLISNLSGEPITVKVPDGFVGVPVLAQFGGGGLGGGGLGGGGLGGGGLGGQGGGQQATGGGLGGGGLGGGGLGGGGLGGGGLGGGGGAQGGGFFSIPAETVVRVPYTSVCLEHGKQPPHPKTPYQMVRIEQYTQDPTLQMVIRMVGTGRLERTSAQAAAWNVANKLSWNDLSQKKFDRAGIADTPYFTRAQLVTAQQIVAIAIQEVEREKEQSAKTTVTPAEPARVPRTSRAQ